LRFFAILIDCDISTLYITSGCIHQRMDHSSSRFPTHVLHYPKKLPVCDRASQMVALLTLWGKANSVSHSLSDICQDGIFFSHLRDHLSLL
jgi:hypothetical protein